MPIILALIAIYLTALTSARTINSKQVTDNEAEIRLGFGEDGFEFIRLTRPSEAYENQLKQLLFPQTVSSSDEF